MKIILKQHDYHLLKRKTYLDALDHPYYESAMICFDDSNFDEFIIKRRFLDIEPKSELWAEIEIVRKK